MKKFLLSSFLFLAPMTAFGETPADAVVKSTFSQSSDWTVLNATIKGSPACLLIEQFSKNQFFVLTDWAASNEFVFTVIDDNWKISSELLSLQIDNTTKYEVTPNIEDNNTFDFFMADDVLVDFIGNFSKGKILKITLPDKTTHSIPLSSSVSTDGLSLSPLDALGKCDLKYIPNGSEPNQPSNTPAPLPPSPSNVLPQSGNVNI
jgi:hypothetical protein